MDEFRPNRTLELLGEIFPGNNRNELIRIKQDLDTFGFQNFHSYAMDNMMKVYMGDSVWTKEKHISLETRVSSAANVLFCLFQYYFDDEEPYAISILKKFTMYFNKDIANNPLAIKSLWDLMVDLHWRSQCDHQLRLANLGEIASCYYTLFATIQDMDTQDDLPPFPWLLSEQYFQLDKRYCNIFEETTYQPIFLIILCLSFFYEGRNFNKKQMAKEIETQLAGYRIAIENNKNVSEEFFDLGDFFDEGNFTSFKEFLFFCNSIAGDTQDVGAAKDEFDEFILRNF